MHQQQIQKVKAGFLTTQKKSGQAWGGGGKQNVAPRRLRSRSASTVHCSLLSQGLLRRGEATLLARRALLGTVLNRRTEGELIRNASAPHHLR